MDINKFIKGLDKLFEEKRINEVEQYLFENLNVSIQENDMGSQFTIFNEMMGFFRDIGDYEKSIKACNDCILLMKKMGIENTIDYATSFQNIANAHRAAGLLKESLSFYKEAFNIYKNNISDNDFRMASINNNIALLYQEMGQYKEAVNHLEIALNIIKQLDESEIETAITYSNLGASLIQLNEITKAKNYLEKALKMFEKDKVKNFHYSATLSALASITYKEGNYEKTINLYEEALKEIEINMGIKSNAYIITKNNLEKVLKESEKKDVTNMELTGIELAEKFYIEYGKDMIHNNFLEYEDKIAVGFVGEGSERFGFDDKFSRDHDFGPGFCMWVTDETYDKIGDKLQEEYDKLPTTFMGITRINTPMAKGRVGVSTINDFYEKYTGYKDVPKDYMSFVNIEDYLLATVTNGVVFRDEEGIFTQIRHNFMDMPEKVRLTKIAREISAMAQTGQCNYERSMGREDYIVADLCVSRFMEHTMKCIYLLNRKYAPYYKWMFKGLKSLKKSYGIEEKLEELSRIPNQQDNWIDYKYSNKSINPADKITEQIEEISLAIIKALYDESIINNINSSFLNDYVSIIMDKANFNRENIIDEIVKLEFEAFDKVKNKGGRADCQNDWPFFYIMRKSQYMTWTDEMLFTIRNLWIENKNKGWNMITEKYGRMMESTAPEEYDEIKDNFPEKSEKTRELVNAIAQIQVGWMEEFGTKYPRLAGSARDITSDKDNLYNTSYETYLKGELLTYSEELLKMYGDFIVKLCNENKNLAYLTIENTAHLQGYKTLDEAEKSLEK